MSDVDTLHQEIKRAYPRHTPRLWLSEFTVSALRANRAFAFFVKTNKEQARWVSAAYRIACRKGYVAGLGWYTLLDEPDVPGSLNNGLMDAGGTPKPAFDAYRKAC
jgi:hypothetical protein